MEKKKRTISLIATSVILLGLGVTSCGPDDIGGNGEYNPVNDTFEKELTLDSENVSINRETTYFAGYLVRGSGKSKEYANAKSEALLKAGEQVQLYFYGVPRTYETKGVKITTLTGSDITDSWTITDGGLITVPSVTQATDYIIYFYAQSDENTIRDAVNVKVVPASEFATGEVNYSSLGGEERTKMAAALETYLLNNGMSPITYMDDSSYTLYSERLSTPFLDAKKYVPGYGYGIMDYGVMKDANPTETNEAYKYYYHTLLSASSYTSEFNYLDSNNADISTLYSYMSSSYYGQLVNEAENGWEYVPLLARSLPVEADDGDGDTNNGVSSKWTVQLRVGGETANEATGVTPGLNYRTGSTNSITKKYDNHPITLDDYITPIKLLATGKINWYRGNEQAGESTANRQIKGFTEYFNSTRNITEVQTNEEFIEALGGGITVDRANNSITFEFNAPVTRDYAEYQLNSTWANPIDEDFVREIGGGNVINGAKIYGTNGSVNGTTLTPIDTILSVGPYYLSSIPSSNSGELGSIIYSKNDNWPSVLSTHYEHELYRMKGFILRLDSSILTNQNAQILAFQNKQVDVSNIPEEYWSEYENSPLRHRSEGESNSQFHINTWDNLFWSERFPEADGKWSVKSVLSNNNFYKGLYVGIDRNSVSSRYHYAPDIDLFAPIDRVSPRSETNYNNTTDHATAISSTFGSRLSENTDVLNNWMSNAADYFDLAIQEELAAGHYSLGTATRPTTITFEMITTNSTYERDLVAAITEDWEQAFALAVSSHREADGSNPWMSGDTPLIRLDVTTHEIAANSATQQDDMLTNGVQAGIYDGQTSYVISGNNYDVLNKLNIYMSDNSSGFTINFGADTTIPSADIYYDGKYWSFDALWLAANGDGITLSETGKIID